MTLSIRLLFLTLLLPALAGASPFQCTGEEKASDPKLLEGVETRYQSITSLSADFVQQSLFVGLDRRELSKGRVFFKKPGMMDWVYEEPEQQRFVADGKNLWFSQPALNQVTVADFKESFTSDLPVTFLLGIGKLREAFNAGTACDTKEGTVIRLEPKQPDSNLQEFLLLVRKGDNTPLGARVLDMAGNETSILFLSTKFNTQLSEDQFTFSPPKGTDIIDQRNNTPNREIHEQDLKTGEVK